MMASVSIAARDSLRVSTVSLVSSQARSVAVRNVHLLADAHQIDAARRVFGLQLRQRVVHVDAVRQAARQRRLVERLGGGEQQRFEQAQFFRRARSARGCRLVVVVCDDHQLLGHTRHRLALLLMRFLRACASCAASHVCRRPTPTRLRM